MIPKQTVDDILGAARVEEVVGEYVNLKKRGANLLGLCPFHNEKTPSFTVSPAKGIYKCFGCGKAGGAVNFLMDHEQFSYPEALRFLANKYNIEIEEREVTPEEQAAANEKESLFIVTKAAAIYFQDQLFNTENGRAIGLSYFKERGFREETIKNFKLGYSPDEWQAFTDFALDKGYKLEYLETTGLTIVKGDKKFDRFKGRVMFPIQNISGTVIGFGGRTLKEEKKTAKYLNSPESEIYHKSRVLYGLHQARNAIVKAERCYLVEGYTDVISMHQAGVENVVSSSGTSLTEGQIRLIKRYTSNITLLFDGDEAGMKAAFRGVDMILGEGMNVKVLAFPEGEDPDTFAQKMSTEDLQTYLSENAHDFIRYKTNLLLKETGDDPMKRAELIRDIVGSIALIPDPIARSVYIQECSDMMDIGEEALMSELNKVRRKKISTQLRRQQQEEQTSTDPLLISSGKEKPSLANAVEIQEKDIIRSLIKFGDEVILIPQEQGEKGEEKVEPIEATVAEFIVLELEQDGLRFSKKLYQTIYELYKNAVENESSLDENHFVSNTDKDISSFAIECLMEKYTLSLNWEEKHHIITVTEEEQLYNKVHKGLCSLRLMKIQEMLKNLQSQLKVKPEEYEGIFEEIKGLHQAKVALAAELGRIVLS